MGKVYLDRADFEWFSDTVSDMEGNVYVQGPARCNLALVGDREDIVTFYNALYEKGSFDIDDLGILGKTPKPSGNCCSYCGKRYDSRETSCHACGGPRI